MKRLATSAALALVLTSGACVYHLDRNAPGTTNVKQPPTTSTPNQLEPPGDPGENILLVGAGGFFGGGFRAGDGSARGTFEAGAEVSVDYGTHARSHNKPTLLPMPPIPKERYGVNLGFTIVESPVNDSNGAEVGPLYLEAHYVDLFMSLSGGYSIDPGDGSHGPQVSAAFAGLYAKTSYRFGRGFDATIGIVMKLPAGIVWSR